MQSIRDLAEKAAASLDIARSIRSIYIEETGSPWNEKALIKRKGGQLDVKITVWKEDIFLPARVFRLFLYIYDVLDPAFHYNPKSAPDEEKEPTITARYNQIWSLYVDSRMERRGMDNFFDRETRRNLFLDMEKDLSWEHGAELFERLWLRESFTYPEILDFSRNLALIDEGSPAPSDAPETDISRRLAYPHVREHIERIPSAEFRDMMNDFLNFTAYHCKDCFIDSSYFGVSFLYQRRVFAELAPTSQDLLYFTVVNPETNAYETKAITGRADMAAAEERVREVYRLLSLHSRNM